MIKYIIPTLLSSLFQSKKLFHVLVTFFKKVNISVHFSTLITSAEFFLCLPNTLKSIITFFLNKRLILYYFECCNLISWLFLNSICVLVLLLFIHCRPYLYRLSKIWWPLHLFSNTRFHVLWLYDYVNVGHMSLSLST